MKRWHEDQWGDAPWYRDDPPGPLTVLLSLIGMCAAVFGILELASRFHR